jgi:protein-S-isoprenylcysteine O-methyltransferase Ste14
MLLWNYNVIINLVVSLGDIMYFIIFLSLFSLRNVADFFVTPKIKLAAPHQAAGRLSLLVLCMAFLVSGIAAAYSLYYFPPWSLWAYTGGCLLLLMGFAGRVTALRAMDNSYNQFIACPQNGLVTTGIYAIIRHPLYLFYLLEMTGFILISINILSIAAWLCVALAARLRARQEDKLLAAAFGEEFAAYEQQTNAFWPFRKNR